MPASGPSTPDDRPRPSVGDSAGARTELAWTRSRLAVLVAVSVLLRRLWPLAGADSVAALVLIAGGATVWSFALRATHRTASEPWTPMSETTARLLSAGTVGLAAGGFLLGFLPTH
jgi:hypothetical protein